MSSLTEGLRLYRQQCLLSFHTPGHKGRREFFYDLDFPADDLTELPGLDILHIPTGIIKEAQEYCAQIFGAEESFFLVNGGTGGNQAMLMALPQMANQHVLIERHAHRSVVGGLILSGHRPQYLKSIVHPDFNLPLGVEWPEQLDWHALLACLITYPGYYGSLPDLKKVVSERREKGREIPILVDQAHGSHYLSSLFPPGGLALGADLVLNSAHKTLSALTQAAILHVQGDLIDKTFLRQCLEVIQTSSPSYLFMASLEQACYHAQDEKRWALLKEAVDFLHAQVGSRLRLLQEGDEGAYGIDRVDWSKILVNTRPIGLSGRECVNYLRGNFGIEPELWDNENILFVLGIGNTPDDVKLLTKGLLSLCDQAVKERRPDHKTAQDFFPSGFVQKLSPREAFLAKKVAVPLKDSLGCIIGETISPYPPGIPWIIAGEIMSEEILEALMKNDERSFQGWSGQREGQILIIDD